MALTVEQYNSLKVSWGEDFLESGYLQLVVFMSPSGPVVNGAKKCVFSGCVQCGAVDDIGTVMDLRGG